MVAVPGLPGCGGGNDAPIPPVATPDSEEGVDAGTLSNSLAAPGTSQLSVVLENGEFYLFYGNKTATAFGVTGFLRGPSVSGLRGFFGATDMREYAPGASSATRVASGIYAAGISLNGSVAMANSTSAAARHTGAAVNDATYGYGKPAVLGGISGAWNLVDLAGARVTLAVGTDGKFTGTVGSCAVSGALTPRASDRHVFDLSLVYGAAPCAAPNLAISGIAIDYLTGSAHQLIAAGNDASRATGIALSGTR